MFCLTGVTSVLSHELTSPIDVSSGDWELGLIQLNTYNSIPNIEKGVNDKFVYGEEGSRKEITIPEGSYEITDLEKYIQSQLGKDIKFTLTPNNNTLKSELFCSEVVDFKTHNNTVRKLLGFDAEILEANKKHVSALPVDIIKVSTIRIECNVTRGSFINGIENHVLHEFYPAVPPGYKIIETPRNVIYLPVNSQRINNLTITIRDQNNDLINFRGEQISVRLHLRRTPTAANGVTI